MKASARGANIQQRARANNIRRESELTFSRFSAQPYMDGCLERKFKSDSATVCATDHMFICAKAGAIKAQASATLAIFDSQYERRECRFERSE